MKRILYISFLAGLVSLANLVLGQKEGKVKEFSFSKDTAYVKGKPAFVVDAKNAATNFYVKNVNGKLLFTVTTETYSHPSFTTSGNPNGKKSYWFFAFPSLQTEFDMIPKGFGFAKDLAKFIAEMEIVKDDKVNEEAVNNHVAMFGTRLTNERNRLQNNNGSINNTIIINR